MTLHLHVDAVIEMTVRICSVGVAVTTLELLIRPRYLAESGLMSWKISRLDHAWQLRGRLARGFEHLYRPQTFQKLLFIRFVISLLMLAGPASVIVYPPLVAVAAFCAVAVPFRSRYGLDAADQLAILVYLGLTFVLIAPSSVTKNAFVAFLAVQCVLAYVIAGVAKAVSAGWRDGTFLPRILCVRNYTPQVVGLFARSHPRLLRLMSRGIVAWECSFPIVLALPLPLALFFLGAGLSFHIVTALVMGLNDFVWAFGSLYPPLVYLLNLRGW